MTKFVIYTEQGRTVIEGDEIKHTSEALIVAQAGRFVAIVPLSKLAIVAAEDAMDANSTKFLLTSN